MKITEKETGEFLKLDGDFNGTEFITCLHALNYSKAVMDRTYIIESYSLEDTKAMITYLTGSPTAVIANLGAELDPSAKEFMLFTPFTGRLEIFNKF